jgi:hypothetical protein
MTDILKILAATTLAIIGILGICGWFEQDVRHVAPIAQAADQNPPPQGTASLSPPGELNKIDYQILRLPPGQKLVQYNYVIGNGNVGHDLTYLTRKMRSSEQPESYRLIRVEECFVGSTKDEHVILIEERPLTELDHTGK